MRSGTYIVPTQHWYIERTVWLIAGFVLLASTTLALLINPLWIFGVITTGLVSINVALTGFARSVACSSYWDSALCWARIRLHDRSSIS